MVPLWLFERALPNELFNQLYGISTTRHAFLTCVVWRWCTSARCEIALQIRHSTLALDLLDESSLARLAEGRVVSRNNPSFAHKEHQGAKDLHLFWAKEVEIRGWGSGIY